MINQKVGLHTLQQCLKGEVLCSWKSKRAKRKGLVQGLPRREQRQREGRRGEEEARNVAGARGPSAGPGISVLLLTRSLGRHTVRPSGRPGFAGSFKDNLATGRPEDQMA